MTRAEFQRVRELFLEACRQPPAGRLAYVDRVCGPDTGLRTEVESLLAHDDDSAAFPTAPYVPRGSAWEGCLPERIGHYRLLECIGRGGMGAVYRAEQDNPRRPVALKLLPPELVSPERRRRMEFEAQILGRLQHVGIAQVFEAGLAELGGRDVPYFAMEYVAGQSLTAFAKLHGLDVRARLELLAAVCDAVQYAHQRGVIHRDLKPGNILVGERGQPKILDFGIARCTDTDVQVTTMHTEAGALIGTLAYMSPEQVAGDPHELDTRSDVYALGVIAFELLTGRLPHDLRDQSLAQALDVIRTQEPARLAAVTPQFRGDLDTIVAKALEKDKTRRYTSASDLAADLRRYLHDQPILARPPTVAYQLRKFAQRNKALAGGLLAALVALTAGVIGTTWQAVLATQERNKAQTAEQVGEQRRVDAERETERARQIQQFLERMITSVNPDTAQGRDTGVLREMLADAAGRVDKELSAQPLVAASVHDTIGHTYSSLHQLEEAEKHARAALELRRQQLGEEHVEFALSLNNLASVLRDAGDFQASQELFERSLAIYRRLLGDEATEIANGLNNLALTLYFRHQLDAAEPLYRQALAMRRKLLGAEHRDVATSLDNLACLLQQKGQFAEAEPLFREALAVRRKLLGNSHPDTLTSLNNLADFLQATRRLDEAEPLVFEALELHRKLIGDDDPDLCIELTSLALLRVNQGKLAEAEPLLREAREIYWRRGEGEHPRGLQALNNLATLLYMRGDYAAAEPLMRELLETRRRVLGDEDADTAQSENALGVLLIAKGEHAAAEAPLRHALRVRREILGAESPVASDTLNNLALCLHKQGNLDTAEALCREGLALARKLYGSAHPRLATALNNLAMVLADREDFQSAEDLFAEGLAMNRQVLGDEHPDVALLQHNLSRVLYQKGDLEAAEQLCRATLALRRRILDSGSPHLAESLITLGRVLLDREQPREAETLMSEGLEVARRALGEQHPTTVQGLAGLGRARLDQGRAQEAEPALREAEQIAARTREGQPDTAMLGVHYGRCLTALQRYDEAEARLSRCSDTLLAALGPKHRAVRLALASLVELYESSGRQEQAAAARLRLSQAETGPK
jgi:non-specific serine/threonine protein kinase/serine/threonine-protein kinase